MNAKGFVLGLVLSAGALSCSGSVVGNERGVSGDAGSDAMPDASINPESSVPPDATPDAADAFEEYVDPGCPDAPTPIFDYQCDPLAPPPGGCSEGEACYPFVSYPADPCDAEVYGSYCLPSGSLEQGKHCFSPTDCAPGFVCVVSGAGNQCVRLCSLTDPTTCPEGEICEPIDVAGYGGCL